MAKHRRSGKDEGQHRHTILRTYFLDEADNLSAISSVDAVDAPRPPSPPEEEGAEPEKRGLDPRQEKWIEICDSRRRYQARLQPAGRLSASLALRRRLLALFSAEQRQTFAAILDFAELFRKGAPGELSLGFETRQILESVDLLYRRLDEGQAAPSPAHGIAAAAEQAIAELRELCRARNVRVQNHLPAGLTCSAADAEVLRQALLNLLLYAVKNSDAPCHVVLAARQALDAAPAIHLCFTHHADLGARGVGAGSAEPRPEVSTYELEGSDLPLLLSEQLLGRMGASLRHERFEGYGSAFEIRIPRAEHIPRGKAVPVPRPPAATSGPAASVKVLYIEDNPDHLVLMERILQKLPAARYLQAGTPELGLALSHLELPDIVLLDIRLPRMSGFEILRQLRASTRTSELRVLALSASALSHDIETGRLLGFRRYLTKPFSVSEFVSILDEEVQDCLRARLAALR